MAIELEPLCTADITLARPFAMPGPYGTRFIIELEEAKISGERLNGTMKGKAGADWAVAGTDGSLRLDVRYLMETDDGALIYVTYTGRSDMSEGPGSAPLYATPTFETGDERYLWLNMVQAVAKGIMQGTSLTYEIAILR